MCPDKIISSILNQYAEIFVPCWAECEYQLDFMSEDKDEPLGVATICPSTQVKNHSRIEKLGKDEYKFYKIEQLTIITENFSKNLNQYFIPMLTTKILQMVDRKTDIFKDWVCKVNFVKSPCYYKKKDCVTRYVC